MSITLNKTDEEITANILREVPEKYQKSVGFWLWDLARAVAKGALKPIYDFADYIVGIFFDIYKMDYDDLVKFVFQRRGIVARKASFSSGSLTIIGNGTITTGDLFETASKMQFQSLETKEIGGEGNVLVQCLTSGMQGNVPTGAISAIPVTIAGIISVSNLEAMVGGYDPESKKSIIERYLEDIQRPITSGNKYHYLKWAKEVTGVGNVKIKPLWNGDNTVKVVIINQNGETANTALVDSVQKYIDPRGFLVSNSSSSGYVQNLPKDYENQFVVQGMAVYIDETLASILTSANGEDFKYQNSTPKGWGCGNGQAPIGAYCTVQAAKEKALDIKITLTLRAGANLETVKEEIASAIRNYFKTTVFNDPYISYARIGACILDIGNVLDYNTLSVNGGNDNVSLEDSNETTEIAVLGNLTIELAGI